MKKIQLIFIAIFALSSVVLAQTDLPTNYESVTIENQVWMAKDLNISTFRNGDIIPEAKTSEQWTNYYTAGKPAWCYYDFKSVNGKKYGKLYNWFAVHDERGLAPEGWRVSNCEDWDILANYAGGTDVAAKKLRSENGWQFDQNGTNEYGFNGLPAGSINAYGMCGDIGAWGSWWCYNPKSNPVYGKYLKYDSDRLEEYASYLKTDGLSVRCILDNKE